MAGNVFLRIFSVNIFFASDKWGAKVGTKSWHQGHKTPGLEEAQAAEVVDLESGGPCRDRTYGPLIKSWNRALFTMARLCNGFPV
jgi:hypothetical protein